jgi:hypothetical protein
MSSKKLPQRRARKKITTPVDVLANITYPACKVPIEVDEGKAEMATTEQLAALAAKARPKLLVVYHIVGFR